MLKKKLLLTVVFIFCFVFAANGQSPLVASVVHTKHTINSTVLGEERTILVRVPLNYAERNEKYPVVYMLDAHPPQNAMMVGIIEQQVWGGQIPDMIVVGIQNTNRGRDMTPTKVSDGRGESGGADKFLQFIETEVIPLVEKNYRTQPYRIFAGHSLGGLLAVYSFVSRPDLFNAYIAASPVLGWDDNFVIKRAEEMLKQKKEFKKTMFLALGDEPDLSKGFNSFQDLLKKTNPKGIDYEFRQFADENHGSVVLPAYYAGLRKIFAGWNPPQPPRGTVPVNAVTDLENHYKKLTERFGYTILIPETTLNQVGYILLRNNQMPEAIEVFRKNSVNYPYSANALDSLAEAFEKNGQVKLAQENYEKAYKMAEKYGEAQLAASAKANYERLSSKSR
jgi:predicted alpha/beta superfamily hydrolase